MPDSDPDVIMVGSDDEDNAKEAVNESRTKARKSKLRKKAAPPKKKSGGKKRKAPTPRKRKKKAEAEAEADADAEAGGDADAGSETSVASSSSSASGPARKSRRLASKTQSNTIDKFFSSSPSPSSRARTSQGSVESEKKSPLAVADDSSLSSVDTPPTRARRGTGSRASKQSALAQLSSAFKPPRPTRKTRASAKAKAENAAAGSASESDAEVDSQGEGDESDAETGSVEVDIVAISSSPARSSSVNEEKKETRAAAAAADSVPVASRTRNARKPKKRKHSALTAASDVSDSEQNGSREGTDDDDDDISMADATAAQKSSSSSSSTRSKSKAKEEDDDPSQMKLLDMFSRSSSSVSKSHQNSASSSSYASASPALSSFASSDLGVLQRSGSSSEPVLLDMSDEESDAEEGDGASRSRGNKRRKAGRAKESVYQVFEPPKKRRKLRLKPCDRKAKFDLKALAQVSYPDKGNVLPIGQEMEDRRQKPTRREKSEWLELFFGEPPDEELPSVELFTAYEQEQNPDWQARQDAQLARFTAKLAQVEDWRKNGKPMSIKRAGSMLSGALSSASKSFKRLRRHFGADREREHGDSTARDADAAPDSGEESSDIDEHNRKKAKCEAPVPEGWSTHLDPKTGRNYYQNHVTNTTQWERPTAPATLPRVNPSLRASSPSSSSSAHAAASSSSRSRPRGTPAAAAASNGDANRRSNRSSEAAADDAAADASISRYFASKPPVADIPALPALSGAPVIIGQVAPRASAGSTASAAVDLTDDSAASSAPASSPASSSSSARPPKPVRKLSRPDKQRLVPSSPPSSSGQDAFEFGNDEASDEEVEIDIGMEGVEQAGPTRQQPSRRSKRKAERTGENNDDNDESDNEEELRAAIAMSLSQRSRGRGADALSQASTSSDVSDVSEAQRDFEFARMAGKGLKRKRKTAKKAADATKAALRETALVRQQRNAAKAAKDAAPPHPLSLAASRRGRYNGHASSSSSSSTPSFNERPDAYDYDYGYDPRAAAYYGGGQQRHPYPPPSQVPLPAHPHHNGAMPPMDPYAQQQQQQPPRYARGGTPGGPSVFAQPGQGHSLLPRSNRNGGAAGAAAPAPVPAPAREQQGSSPPSTPPEPAREPDEPQKMASCFLCNKEFPEDQLQAHINLELDNQSGEVDQLDLMS